MGFSRTAAEERISEDDGGPDDTVLIAGCRTAYHEDRGCGSV